MNRDWNKLPSLDVLGNELRVGDYVQGHRGYVDGDGYMRKGYPKKVRHILEIKWNDGSMSGIPIGYYLDPIGVHEDDLEAIQRYNYRYYLYNLKTNGNRILTSLLKVGDKDNKPEFFIPKKELVDIDNKPIYI